MKKADLRSGDSEMRQKVALSSGLLEGDITIKTLLESLAEGVVVINEARQIIFINNRMAELTGYEKDEVKGQYLNIFIPQSVHDKESLLFNNYFVETVPRPLGIGLELTMKRKDEFTFPVEIRMSFLNTEVEKLTLFFITDITIRKRAEQELEKRNIELDAYAHTVAHDLSSTLVGMVSYSELMLELENEFSSDQLHSFLREVALSGRKMNNIVNELLLFASIKKEDVEIKNINVRKTIEGACNRLRFQIKERSAKIIIADNIVNCKGYAAWVEEVVYNLISNAIKYGGNPPTIEIYSKKTANGFITYSVKDNGNGIADDLKAVIFQDIRLREGLTKGSGFGLLIAKRIMEKLDGSISVESEHGKGSIISFSLKE